MSFAVLVSLAAIIIDQLYRLLTVENKWIAVPYKPDLLVFDPNTVRDQSELAFNSPVLLSVFLFTVPSFKPW